VLAWRSTIATTSNVRPEGSRTTGCPFGHTCH
jgi:hypothetical protein